MTQKGCKCTDCANSYTTCSSGIPHNLECFVPLKQDTDEDSDMYLGDVYAYCNDECKDGDVDFCYSCKVFKILGLLQERHTEKLHRRQRV
jgi:hypothetical protein